MRAAFTIKNERHIEYRQEQECEVYLVHRRSDGVIHWMNVIEYLRKRKNKEKKQIVFEGEPLHRLAGIGAKNTNLAKTKSA